MTNNYREVHTSLYSQHAKDMLMSVIGQWSDGMWENSPKMDRYWRFSSIKSAPDGEVLIEVSNVCYEFDKWAKRNIPNGFHQMSDDDVKHLFARYLKTIAKADLADNGSGDWKRDNMNEVGYLDRDTAITFAEVYALYDYLLGRKNRSTVDIIGKKLSLEETEHNCKIIAEKKLIADEYAQKFNELDAWKKQQIEMINQKEAELEKSLREEAAKKLAAVC